MDINQENKELRGILSDLIQTLSGVSVDVEDDLDRIKQYSDIVKNSFKAKYDLQADHLNALDAAVEGIAIVNERNKFIYHNKTFTDFFNIEGSIIDSNWKAVFPKEVPTSIKEMLRESSLSYPTFHELKLNFDGKLSFYAVSFYPQKNRNLLVTVNDITEEKKSLAKISANNILIEKANEIMLSSDLEFNVFFMNASGKAYFGNVENMVDHLEVDKEFIKRLKHSAKIDKGFNSELKIDKSGEDRFLEIEVHYFEEKDWDRKGYHWIIRDVSNRKRNLKAILESKRKAEESSIIKQNFLANMTKDVRTPINSIISAVSLIRNTPLNPAQEGLLGQVGMSAENLKMTFDDILDLSDIQEGKLELLRVPTKFFDFLNNKMEEFDAVLQGQSRKLSYYIDEAIQEVEYLVDTARLNQVLLNLINFLIEHTAIGEELFVRIIISHKYRDKHEISFEITANGLSLTKDFIRNIERTEHKVTNLIEKIGIGLTAAKQLLSIAGISLKVVEKESSTGFTFVNDYFISDSKAKATENGIKLDKFKAIYIDDNQLNQLMIKSYFEQWGMNYYIVDHASKVIEVTKKSNPNIIFTHLNAKNDLGNTAIRGLRNAGVKAPIVAVTNAVFDQERSAAIEAGVNDFLLIPFDEKALLEQVLIYGYTKPEDLFLVVPQVHEPVSVTLGFGIQYLTDMGAGDPSFTDEMLNTFVSQAVIEIKNIIKWASIPDFDALAKAAHKLQPSFILVDRQDLVQRWKEVEVLCKNGGIDENLSEKLDVLIQDCKSVMEKVQDYLGLPLVEMPPFIAWKYYEFEKEDIKISLEKLESIFEQDKAGMRSTLDVFYNQLSHQSELIKNYVLKNDWDAIIIEIHNIQGSVNLVQAKGMYQFGLVLEKYLEDKMNSAEAKTDQVMRYLESLNHLKNLVKKADQSND
jgi:CheY-like chemotaxis protein